MSYVQVSQVISNIYSFHKYNIIDLLKKIDLKINNFIFILKRLKLINIFYLQKSNVSNLFIFSLFYVKNKVVGILKYC